MTFKDQEVNQTAGRIEEHRAYPRQPVRLPAVFTLSRGGIQHPCEIRDFCPGGMLLAYDPMACLGYLPRVGDVIDLQTSLQAETGSNIVTFTARVTRTDGHSAGVALINPEVAALGLMQAFAQEQREGDTADQPYAGDISPISNKSARGIIDAYRRLYVDALDPIMQAFSSAADERFFELARTATSMPAQSTYISAQETIKHETRDVTKRMQAVLASHMRNSGLTDGKPGGRENAPASGTTLTLMEEDTLQDWLAVSDVVDFVESRHQIVLSEIERRLSYLHQAPMSRETNPVGPAILAQSFQQAVASLNLERSVKQVCFTIFKSVLSEHLPQLYDKVNDLLIESGVLPYLKPEIMRQPDSVAQSGQDSNSVGQETAPSDDVGQGPDTGPSPDIGGSRRDAPGARGYAGGDAFHGHDLYQIVRDLRELQQTVNQGAARAAPVTEQSWTYPVQGGQPSSGVYDTKDILSALSHMQSSTNDMSQNALQGMDFQSRFMSVLEAQSPGGVKHLAERESGIVDVAGSLFDSMLQDMLVAKSVRGWLERLEIPILKLAIVDDSLFLDRSHVARQVVNRISQLELYGDGKDSSQSAIRRKVGSLIERIVNEIDSDPGVFAKVLKELDLLIQIQNEAYADNLHDVIAHCESEQSAAPDMVPKESGPEWERRNEWIKRARRLRVGSWLLMEAKSGDRQRLRLAWISKNEDRYVFVNLRGLREASLSVADLAKRLRDGTAIVLDNADEPAIDRAQYAMLQTLHRKLVHESTHDQLTGLINRREFEQRFREAVDDIGGPGDECSLCYIDIDQFSVINTTCGYDAGDRLLIEISGLIKGSLGGDSIVARLGSDEFAVLLEKLPVREAMKIVENLSGAVRAYRFKWEDKRFAVSFSIGMVEADERQRDPAALLQAAESSCRAARERGVNNIQIYRSDDSLLSSRKQTAQWLSRIDKALDDGVLDLRYQRIMPLQSDEYAHPLHAEVLMTLVDEDGKRISPQEFIVAAEYYHRIPAVDRLVVQSVFRWMVNHPGELDTIGGFSINLSGRSLSDETFLDFVLKEAESTGVPMDRVCFEVTETAGISNLSDATEFILQVKKTGCLFSLDDFGSGFSSYTYLKNLPVDFLKIDGAFVKEMDKNPSDFAVVKSISEIGHFMGKKIVAEYVENETVLNLLREIGVDYAQGFVVDAPRPLAV